MTSTAPLPERPRPEDRALHADVRWLASALGQVVLRLEGREAFDAVESLRAACRARRRGLPDALDLEALLARVDALPLATAAVVARAFTLFFLLINTAEQVHRVRRRQDYARGGAGAQPGSLRWAMDRLGARGVSRARVAEALGRLDVRPVVTAHPTEATRRTLLDLQARVASALLARGAASPDERRLHEQTLSAEVELLWVTAEVRRDRPSVLDEVSTMLWYLEDRLLPATGALASALRFAFEDVFGEGPAIAPPVHPGSWVGGDRDGNPFVTPEVTLRACRRGAFTVLGHYLGELRELTARLSVSARLCPPGDELRASLDEDRALMPRVFAQNQRRDADEPLRLKLSFMAGRLEATRRSIAARDAGRPELVPEEYPGAAAFAADLALVQRELGRAGAELACRALLDPLASKVQSFGFHGFRLDLREDSDAHTQALEDLARQIGLPPLEGPSLRRELEGSRPLKSPHLRLSAATEKTLGVFAAMRAVQDELGEAAASTYIVSMTHHEDDLLRVLLMARDEGLVDLGASPPRSRLDVVPLFETHADLVESPRLMRALFTHPAYARQLEARAMRQEVMIGYSDSAKDVGLLPASWALYRAQEELLEVARAAGVDLLLFHGQGGTVGRGGGSPVYRALLALPPGSIGGRIKITEQGEVISQKFGLLPLAERSLEVMVSGTLMALFEDFRTGLAPGEEARFREVMERLSATALRLYRATVHDDPRLFKMLEQTTPLRELSRVHYGSRPAYRDKGSGTMKGIRAIPWVFGWTQTRLLLPGWLGVGTAIAEVSASAGGLEVLQRMAEIWPYFADLLAKVEMVCAKSDMEIARAYVTRLGGDLRLFAELEAEYRRTVEGVLAVRRATEMLSDAAVLRASIALRNPYVDPLSLLQVSLLGRKRALGEGASAADAALLDEALGATLNGVAQGLRNTG